MGYYDLPAVIDFILGATESKNLAYVGHSQGTTELLTLLATRPEYNEKIRVAALMAPVAFLDRTKGTVRILAAFNGLLSRIAKLLGIYKVLTNSYWIHFVDTTLCEKTAPTILLCENFLFALSGFDRQQFNMSLLPLIADQGPSGASIKQLEHFGQLSNNVRQYYVKNQWCVDNTQYFHVSKRRIVTQFDHILTAFKGV
ncbi:unnamed protein product [Nesidiocoris tenuis]|uniref:AB hydrolase-1 domain-containing protein n=1 Tax=Nesidiocoris tenuis TaxID=355587 RepID=A0A6H5H951_9HEMI|nr:unnamed protein product [Nesidiocoris tenuis]